MLLTVLSASVMMWVSKLETLLPSRHAIALTLSFHQDYKPNMDDLAQLMLRVGYEIAKGSLTINFAKGKQEWHFSAVALLKHDSHSIPDISQQVSKIDGMESFHVAFARN
jgi:putative Mg2+ transporter-C (MgtC) family protein